MNSLIEVNEHGGAQTIAGQTAALLERAAGQGLVLDAQLLDRARYLALGESLESFLVRLRDGAEIASLAGHRVYSARGLARRPGPPRRDRHSTLDPDLAAL